MALLARLKEGRGFGGRQPPSRRRQKKRQGVWGAAATPSRRRQKITNNPHNYSYSGLRERQKLEFYNNHFALIPFRACSFSLLFRFYKLLSKILLFALVI